MSVDYLVVGGNKQGNIITRDKLVTKLAIIDSVMSSTNQNKPSQNIGFSMDVMLHGFNGNRYAIAINGSFSTDILDELIIEYKPNPIPNELIR